MTLPPIVETLVHAGAGEVLDLVTGAMPPPVVDMIDLPHVEAALERGVMALLQRIVSTGHIVIHVPADARVEVHTPARTPPHDPEA